MHLHGMHDALKGIAMALHQNLKPLLLVAALLSTANLAHAQSNAELARAAQNLAASLFSLPF